MFRRLLSGHRLQYWQRQFWHDVMILCLDRWHSYFVTEQSICKTREEGLTQPTLHKTCRFNQVLQPNYIFLCFPCEMSSIQMNIASTRQIQSFWIHKQQILIDVIGVYLWILENQKFPTYDRSDSVRGCSSSTGYHYGRYQGVNFLHQIKILSYLIKPNAKAAWLTSLQVNIPKANWGRLMGLNLKFKLQTAIYFCKYIWVSIRMSLKVTPIIEPGKHEHIYHAHLIYIGFSKLFQWWRHMKIIWTFIADNIKREHYL